MYAIFPWKTMHLKFHTYKGSSAGKTTNKTTTKSKNHKSINDPYFKYMSQIKKNKARATKRLNRNLFGCLNLAYILIAHGTVHFDLNFAQDIMIFKKQKIGH